MARKTKPHPYHSSLQKSAFDLILSTTGIIILSPVILVFSILIKLTSKGPMFFGQKRVGKGGRTFKIIMFRTMYVGAESDQHKYSHLNEADGPVFKIRDDPRFVGIGKFLAKTGLDELPQLINVLRGEMSLVGPRPLPINEARKLTKIQKVRELVKPGMTSPWVVQGAHSLSFKEWMRLDQEYIREASLSGDIWLLFRTIILVPKLLFT